MTDTASDHVVSSNRALRVEHLSLPERVAAGKAARGRIPRGRHVLLEPRSDRDTVGLIEQEGAGRVQELLPIRYARMLASPFAFYRGTASLMAGDLGVLPNTGLNVQLCGDAHLANFGGFASPDRDLVFDLNDFDETLTGPFEWDVKRLAASFEIAARHRGLDERMRRPIVALSVEAYRRAIREFAEMTNLEVWYSRLNATAIAAGLRESSGKAQAASFERAAEKARRKDSSRALTKLTSIVDGEPRILSQPPLLVPIAELSGSDAEHAEIVTRVRELLRVYRRSLQADRRRLLEQYRYVDMGRKVVGVGSVGSRCWIVLLLGKDANDPLILQIKEASESALEPHLAKSRYRNHGQRIVEGQRMMQAASDIFLGWVRNPEGLDGVARDFYVRQLWDWKVSVDLELIAPKALAAYAQVCGWTLARAHARSGDRVAIASYLGATDVFDKALAEFASAYADLAEQDFSALEGAAKTRRIVAAEG
jgi:uncharacterized protein (DUF2252 family)